MKLRHVINAISGHKYVVDEYTIAYNGRITKDRIEIGRSETDMRRLQADLHHEKLVGDVWILLTPEEFQYHLTNLVPKEKKALTVIRRSTSGEKKKVASRALSFLQMVTIDPHFVKRAHQRFKLLAPKVTDFITNCLDAEHHVVQGWQIYNQNSKKYQPADSVIACPGLNALLIVRFRSNRYELITCYPLNDSGWYLKWLDENSDAIPYLPTIDIHFDFKMKN